MSNFWGIPVQNFNWTYEDGRKFEPDEIYPVVDPYTNRIFGIKKDDESDVVVVQSYDPQSQPNAALHFAKMVWGEPKSWERPDKRGRMVSCLGNPACLTCMGEEDAPMIAMGSEWRITPFSDTSELYARVLLSGGDPINEKLSDYHLMADVGELAFEPDDIRKELTRRALSLFGPLVDADREQPEAPSILQYNIVLHPADPNTRAQFHRTKQDIMEPMTRLYLKQ
jgi:hypothetical protein